MSFGLIFTARLYNGLTQRFILMGWHSRFSSWQGDTGGSWSTPIVHRCLRGGYGWLKSIYDGGTYAEYVIVYTSRTRWA